MLVEFIGPPGAGKSTLAGLLAERMDVRLGRIRADEHPDGRPVSRTELWRGRIVAPLRQPKLSYQLGRVIVKHRCQPRWALELCRRSRITSCLKGTRQDTILEDGPLHVLCRNAAEMQMDDATVRRVLRSLTRPDVCVLVVVPPELALTRLLARSPGNWRREMETNGALDDVRRFSFHAKKIASDVGAIRVDNSDNPLKLVGWLAEQVERVR